MFLFVWHTPATLIKFETLRTLKILFVQVPFLTQVSQMKTSICLDEFNVHLVK